MNTLMITSQLQQQMVQFCASGCAIHTLTCCQMRECKLYKMDLTQNEPLRATRATGTARKHGFRSLQVNASGSKSEPVCAACPADPSVFYMMWISEERLARPGLRAELFLSDYLGTDWQLFHGGVREPFKSPYLSRERGRKKGKNTTLSFLPKSTEPIL